MQPRKQVLRAATLIAGGVLLAFASGCTDPETPAQVQASAAGAAAAVKDAVEVERQRLRNLEGREGILAQERLYSLMDEELIIRDFFQDRRGGFFLDVGCAWPIDANNTYYLEKHLDWTGIGIDALAEFGPAWEKDRPGSKFFAFLVSDHSNVSESFFRSQSPGLSSTSRNMARGRVFGADIETEEIQVPSITLDDLLAREGVTKIDLLAMDIEGHEAKALLGFDIDRFRPELAIVEHSMQTPGAPDRVYDYFVEHGYAPIEKYQRYDQLNRYFAQKPR